MKFGLQQLYNKTPKLMVRLGLAFKAISAMALPGTLSGSKLGVCVAIIGLLGAFLVAFFGEENDILDKPSN